MMKKLFSIFATSLFLAFSSMTSAQTLEEEFAAAEKRHWTGSDRKQQRQLYRIFKDLSERGHACAHRLLASYYVTGNIPSQNYDKAFSLASKAYDMGCKGAAGTLAFYYKRGIGTDIDLERSLNYYKEAAQNGDHHAAYEVFKVYRKGYYRKGKKGIGRNLIKAYEWLTYAANHGNQKAQRELKSCNYNGFFCESYLDMTH